MNTPLEVESEHRCYFESDQQGASFTQEFSCNSLYLQLDGGWRSTDSTGTSVFIVLLDTLQAVDTYDLI